MEKEYQDITVNEVKEYMKKHREDHYQLIDVRWEEEYTEEHLPGSVLITLDELEERISEISLEKDIIFYCLSGRRSVAASLLIGSNPDFSAKIYNMLGGILAWDGQCLPDIPDIKVFGISGSDEEMLYQAMNLEKGAHIFYEQVVEKLHDTEVMDTIATLVHAEEVHAKMIYSFWEKTQTNPPSFETLYDSLPGDILEGGKTVEELTDKLAGTENRCKDVLEMAMMIECSAYDLYRTMAHMKKNTSLEKPFLHLCQSEKSHMRLAIEALAKCN